MTATSTTSCCPRTSPPTTSAPSRRRCSRSSRPTSPSSARWSPSTQAKEIFADQRFKLEHIDDLADEQITIYRHGSFVDLCSGPHIPSAGKIGAIKLMKLAGAYWRADASREQLQRLYGTAFFKKAELDEYLHNLEEAEKRDHRKIGREMDLFMMRDEAPGFPFFLPNGMVLKNTLLDYWREIHHKRRLRRDLHAHDHEQAAVEDLRATGTITRTTCTPPSSTMKSTASSP